MSLKALHGLLCLNKQRSINYTTIGLVHDMFSWQAIRFYIPTIGMAMEYIKDINSLDSLPDVQIVERKVLDGKRGAIVYIMGRLARDMCGCDHPVVKWIPMDYVDTVETMLEAEGYSVSRA